MHKSTRLATIMVALALASLVVTLQSFGKGGQGQQNSSTNRSGSEPTRAQQAPRAAQDTWDLPANADKTNNTVEATEESIAKGKELFMAKKANCVFCHGETGAGNEVNLAKLRRVPADLSDKVRMPKLSDGEIFWKITKGIPGIMPGREKELTEEERWHVVNFVRTLAKKNRRSESSMVYRAH